MSHHDPAASDELSDAQLDELARSFAQLKLQHAARDARSGDPCPRCVQRNNPRPGRLGANMDGDLACHVCGHVVYQRHGSPRSSPRSSR